MLRVAVETIVLHSGDPRRLAIFWCSLLGYEVVPNYTPSIQLADPRGGGPRLLIAHSPDTRAPGAMHLDLRPVRDRDAVVQRALDLGARREQSDADTSWTVLLDPDGNRFCVLQSVEAYAAWRRDTDQPFTTSM